MIVAASGHRSYDLGTNHMPRQIRLVEFAESVLADLDGVDAVVSGMALGWDQAVARAAVGMGIPLLAYVPFRGQEKYWGSTDRAIYRRLLEDAQEVHVVDETGLPVRDAYMARNEAMVDVSNLVLGLWDGRSWGGTFNCLKYAHERRVRVMQLYQAWQDFRGW